VIFIIKFLRRKVGCTQSKSLDTNFGQANEVGIYVIRKFQTDEWRTKSILKENLGLPRESKSEKWLRSGFQ